MKGDIATTHIPLNFPATRIPEDKTRDRFKTGFSIKINVTLDG